MNLIDLRYSGLFKEVLYDGWDAESIVRTLMNNKKNLIKSSV
jgi:hypothetical protein